MKYLIINSSQKTNGSSTNFTYEITETVDINQHINLIYASIPITSYLINNTNNIFKIKFASDILYTIINIPNGTYEPFDLCILIQSMIPVYNFKMTYSLNSLKISMSANQAFIVDWTINNNLYNILGYDISQISSDINNQLNANNIGSYLYP